MYMNLDLLVPVMWKLSMPQENNTVSGFSGSFWLRPLQLLPNDGTRGTDAVWEVMLAERRGGWRAHHKIIISLNSFTE